jgi:hypothetical protein
LAGFLFFFLDFFFKGKRTALMAAAIALGVLIAPSLNAYRSKVTVLEAEQYASGLSFNQTLLSYDYDSFQILAYTFLTVDKIGTAKGMNIVGAFMFFVPRSWWPQKPEPTCFTIYDQMLDYRSVGTNNLSTPLMAEGYYAFGWLGVLLVSLAYWWFVFWIDRISRKDSGSLSFLWRCVFSGLVLIFLRGTLMVATGAVFGAMIASAIPWLLLAKEERTNQDTEDSLTALEKEL